MDAEKFQSEDEFHEQIHKDIEKPVKDFRRKWNSNKKAYTKVRTDAHRTAWASAKIQPKLKLITINVYLNFKSNELSPADYEKLKALACEGINQYWSRRITVGSYSYFVTVKAQHREDNSIPVDLYIETDSDEYARSMNPSILGIDASFIYNKGRLGAYGLADDDFRLVSAHEFGHSVLMYSGGVSLSWGHKGTTNSLTQSANSSAPGYPKSGHIDLMKYYDSDKGSAFLSRIVADSISMEIDVKRLIWGAQIRWIE